MEKSDEPRRNIRNSSLRSLISLGCLEDSFRFFSLLPSSMDSPAIKGNKKKKKNEKKKAQGQSEFRYRPGLGEGDTHRVLSLDPPLVGEVRVKGGNHGVSLCVSLDVKVVGAGAGDMGAANHGRFAHRYLHSFPPDHHTLDLPYAVRHWGPSWTTILLARLACLGRWAERRPRRKGGR